MTMAGLPLPEITLIFVTDSLVNMAQEIFNIKITLVFQIIITYTGKRPKISKTDAQLTFLILTMKMATWLYQASYFLKNQVK